MFLVHASKTHQRERERRGKEVFAAPNTMKLISEKKCFFFSRFGTGVLLLHSCVH